MKLIKSKKIVFSILSLIGISLTISTAFGIYTIVGTSNKSLLVNDEDIIINNYSDLLVLQTLGSNDKMYTAYDLIVSDEIVLPFLIKTDTKYDDVLSSGGMRIEFNIPNDSLFNYTQHKLINEKDFFISIIGKQVYEMNPSTNYTYLKNNVAYSIFEVDYTNNKFNIHLPFTRDHSEISNFNIWDLKGNIINSEANFSLKFDFDIIDESLGYSTLFSPSDFNNFKIDIFIEVY